MSAFKYFEIFLDRGLWNDWKERNEKYRGIPKFVGYLSF